MLEIYDGDDKVRFTLGIKGVKTLIVFGVNPSCWSSIWIGFAFFYDRCHYVLFNI